ncbi:NUDIX hydrolase domain-like protein [Aspergillus egyptiacus]|nr:NUDIX hydrolase domain-like protein [Aspergillus egyptiacus]
MASKLNYTVAPHLSEFTLPFPTFRTTRPDLTDYVGGALIFSRTARTKSNQEGEEKTKEENSDGSSASQPLRVLLLQRSYDDSWGGHWEGPGGSCDPEDATLLDGVAREVLEETGLHVSRFVDLVAVDRWVRTRPDRVQVAAKFTFIVEVQEARPAVSVKDTGSGEDGLPADKLDDGRVVEGLERRWEERVTLDPAEHRAFEWVTEEDIREGNLDGDEDEDAVAKGKYKSFGQQGETILKAFRMLSEKVQ